MKRRLQKSLLCKKHPPSPCSTCALINRGVRPCHARGPP